MAKEAAAEETPATGGKKEKKAKRKEKRVVPHGVAHIQATFNNTIVTLSDAEGGVVGWSSAGKVGFKGSRKGTPFAAQMAAQNVTAAAREAGMRTVDVLVTGPGAGRESAIRSLQANGLDIKTIRDVTPIPHNGCRPRKRRRV
jgi:small subunit ribosomal protein S11